MSRAGDHLHCGASQSRPSKVVVLNIAGEITVAAPREAVFKALSNAPFFASCIEGVRDLTAIDATHYDAVLETRIAYLRFKFKVDVEMTRDDAARRNRSQGRGHTAGYGGPADCNRDHPARRRRRADYHPLFDRRDADRKTR